MTAQAVSEAAEYESWDAFWREVQSAQTETIRGVEVPVPTDAPLNFEDRLRALLGSSTLEDFEQLVRILFGEGVFRQWYEAGMGRVELLSVLLWGMSAANGRRIGYKDAYQQVTKMLAKAGDGGQPGKGPAAGKKTASRKKTASGGPSKPTGGR